MAYFLKYNLSIWLLIPVVINSIGNHKVNNTNFQNEQTGSRITCRPLKYVTVY